MGCTSLLCHDSAVMPCNDRCLPSLCPLLCPLSLCPCYIILGSVASCRRARRAHHCLVMLSSFELLSTSLLGHRGQARGYHAPLGTLATLMIPSSGHHRIRWLSVHLCRGGIPLGSRVEYRRGLSFYSKVISCEDTVEA